MFPLVPYRTSYRSGKENSEMKKREKVGKDKGNKGNKNGHEEEEGKENGYKREEEKEKPSASTHPNSSEKGPSTYSSHGLLIICLVGNRGANTCGRRATLSGTCDCLSPRGISLRGSGAGSALLGSGAGKLLRCSRATAL